RVGMLPVYEFAAEDIYGSYSSLWPYLTIIDRSRHKSPPVLNGDFDATDVSWRVQSLMDIHSASVPEDPSGIYQVALASSDGPSEPTPIPLGNMRPVVYVGGFYPPMIDISQTNQVLFKALVLDPNGPEDIEHVEVYVDGIPTGIDLLDDGSETDDVPGDGFYIRNFTVDAYSRPEGLLLLQVVAFDYSGAASNVYPYITVEP
ncbi:MAG: hypothetical protein JW941_11280, partial [Candidatus Coatesbacteria bacterium]|nr:hypothetical protein [Candidatus Coatesbacteria bacterium]